MVPTTPAIGIEEVPEGSSTTMSPTPSEAPTTPAMPVGMPTEVPTMNPPSEMNTEPSMSTMGTAVVPMVPSAYCGNGVLDEGEECDQGSGNGDAECSLECTLADVDAGAP